MSVSFHVVGFRPPDDKWREMKAVWDTCIKADVPMPNKVLDFFCGEEPTNNGTEVDIDCAISRIGNNCNEGFDVDLKRLPEDVYVIRFYASW